MSCEIRGIFGCNFAGVCGVWMYLLSFCHPFLFWILGDQYLFCLFELISIGKVARVLSH